MVRASGGIKAVFIVAIFALLASSCHALTTTQVPSLQKYSYVFDAPQKSALGTLKDFMPTCQAIEKNEVSLASTGASEYAQSEGTARQALEKAQGLSGVVEQAIATIKEFVRMIYSTNANIPSDSLENALNSFARPCNSESFESIKLVLLSDSQAWEKLSAKAESFRQAYGDSGPAGKCEAVRAKLSQMAAEFEAGTTGSESIAQRALGLRAVAQREATDGALFSPRDARTVIVEGISRDSVLSEIYSFDSEITDALISLDAAFARQKKDAQEWQALAEGALKRYQDEGLAGLDGLGLFSKIPSRFLGTTAKVGGYRETERLAQAAIAKANGNVSLAEFSTKAMQYGYESESIARYLDAKAGFEKAVEILESKTDEATALESGLDDEVAQRVAKIRQQLEELKKTDALAAQKIEELLSALEKGYDKSGYNLAQRLSACADLLVGIENIEAALSDNDNALLETTYLMYSDFSDLLSRAATDGISTQYEIQVAGTIKQSLDLAKSKKAAVSDDELSAFQQQITLMDAKVVERARTKYAALDSQYSDARSLEAFLGNSDLARLDAYGIYFITGKLDARRALGRLSEMTEFLLKMTGSANAGLGAKIQDAIQQNLYEVPQESEPAQLGCETTVKRGFSCRNPTGISYDGAIKLKLFSIPSGAALSDTTGRFYEVNGVVYARLDGASAYGECLLDVEYTLVVARKTGESIATAYADFDGAQITRTITFESVAQYDVLVLVPVPLGAIAYSQAGYAKQYQSGDTAAFIVPAKVGRNELVVTIASAEYPPFSLVEKKTALTSQRVSIELSYTNAFEELQNPKIAYTQAECTSARSMTVESTDFTYVRSGNEVRLSFSGKWAKGKEKRAVLTVECDNSTQTAALQAGILLSGYDATLLNALVQAGLISATTANSTSPVAKALAEIQSIVASAAALPEYSSVAKIAAEAQAILQNASLAADAAAQQKAADKAASKLSELEEIANYRYTALYKQCGEPSCKRLLEEARALIAAKDWPTAFEKLSQYQKQAEQDAAALAQEYDGKLSDYAGYSSSTIPLALLSLSRFDNATAISANQSSATYSRLKGEGYDHAAALKVREQLQKAMDKIRESYPVASKAFNASSKADLLAQYANVRSLAQQLDGYTDKLAQVTQAQLDIARQSAAADAQASLSAADSDASDGNYLSAYLLAKQLQQETAGAVAVKAAGAFSLTEYLPYLAAIVIIGGAAYAYLRKDGKESYEALEKPPDDYSN
ncbi:MAG: hypothetical protein WCX64_02620 [Candidatus Micrarchaeia archaeon]